MMISEILYQQPAHRIGCKLCYLHVTDAKSLYDTIVSPNPSLSDKRSLVNVRAVQEKVSPQQMRWVPTCLMFADGLTKIFVSFRQSMHDWLRAPSVKLKDEQGPKKTVGGQISAVAFCAHWTLHHPRSIAWNDGSNHCSKDPWPRLSLCHDGQNRRACLANCLLAAAQLGVLRFHVHVISISF